MSPLARLSDGKRAPNPVDVGLVLDQGLSVGFLRGGLQPEPDLWATLILDDTPCSAGSWLLPAPIGPASLHGEGIAEQGEGTAGA